MNRFLLLLSFLFLMQGVILKAQSTRSNCPVKAETFTRQNPDGSILTLRVHGSEMVHYFETVSGYTVLENQSGFYEYATLDVTGNLVTSGIVARNGDHIAGKNLVPKLRYSDAQLQAMEQAFYAINSLEKKAGGKPFPSKGKRNVLVLLIQYPDLNASLPKNNFDSLMNKVNYNGTGSFRDYYLKTSFGQLELNADVFGWYMAPQGYLSYGKASSGYLTNVGNLVKRAVLSADSMGVDFTKYDNDSDGYVDGLIVLHAGIGAEEQSAPSANNYIWSHRYNLRNTVGAVSVDGVSVDAYGIFPEKRYSGGLYNMVGIGVITHEFGHLLDLPDLYSTNDNGEGAGNFANMAGGPWLNNEKTPCLHDAWSRMALGWVTPVVLPGSGNYRIAKPLADSNFVYQINTSRPNEYFLLENRQKRGFDLFLPSRGLAVWHINTNKAKKLTSSSANTVNTDTSQYGVGLLQADGNNDLEKGNNRGDAGDLYPGNTNNKSLGASTKPTSSLHYKVGGIAQPSNVELSNITLNADSSVTFTFGNVTSAGFDAIPSQGCAPLMVQLNNTSANGTRFLWKFPGGGTSNQTNENKTFDSAGVYQVWLNVVDSAGNTIDSTARTITVSASPTAEISVARGDSNTFHLKSLAKNALYVVWRFGSNQSSSSTELDYTISGNSDVPYMLIAYGSNLCSDTVFGVLSYWPLGLQQSSNAISEVLSWPNPFGTSVHLRFLLAETGNIQVKLTDLSGRQVRDYGTKNLTAGTQELELDTYDLPPGIYLLEAGNENFKKIIRVQRGAF